jgi:hypothetical protein
VTLDQGEVLSFRIAHHDGHLFNARGDRPASNGGLRQAEALQGGTARLNRDVARRDA